MLGVRSSKGEDSPDSYDALQEYVDWCTEITINLMERQENEAAKQVLEQVDHTLRTGISQKHPNLLYKINYRFAELANS